MCMYIYLSEFMENYLLKLVIQWTEQILLIPFVNFNSFYWYCSLKRKHYCSVWWFITMCAFYGYGISTKKKKQKNTHYSLPLPHYCILLASVLLFVSTISFSAAHIFLLYSWYIERNSRIKMTWITIRNNNNDKSYMKIGWNVLLNCNLSNF